MPPLIVPGLAGSWVAPLLLAGLLVIGACRQAQEEPGEETGARAADEKAAAPADESLPASSAGTPGDAPSAPDTADTSSSSERAPQEQRATAGSATERPPPPSSGPASEQTGSGESGKKNASGEGGEGVDWMRVDEAARKVTFDVVAGLTAENSAWNFNGYANGEMTITVPVGWTVVINFSSRDADVPHSIYIIDEKPPFPTMMPTFPDIPKAYSANLQNGIGPGKKDTLRFTVDKPGRYTMPCGVPGHAASGMWDRFVVSADARRPTVTVSGAERAA